ncbi:hypothetical protein KR222_004640, partial [Zaprionus bogoriensis]
DEYSWLASLEYDHGSPGICAGSVISSSYVLTTANCVLANKQRKLTGVRLGNFANNTECDYGTGRCQDYQWFGIAKTHVHEGYRVVADRKWTLRRENNIALIRLSREIEFGPRMKPVCLPIAESQIEQPSEDSFSTVAGWWKSIYANDVISKRSATVAYWNTITCEEYGPNKETQICGVKPGQSPCVPEYGSAMMYMFAKRQMVLEGMVSEAIGQCPASNVAAIYTRVRGYVKWIEKTIKV